MITTHSTHSNTTMASTVVKLEGCEVCGDNSAKYTCPKCEVRTCSLKCVNIHKKELECDGIRNKTKFIPLKSFTDLDILSDYRLLEKIGKSVDQLKRNPMKKCTRQTDLPVHLNKLKSAAYRRKVNLQYMPQNFNRHKENTTFLNWKTNELFWRIEWIFPQSQNTQWITERALETARLSSIVETILYPLDSFENKSDMDQLNIRLILNDKLQFYQSAGLSGIKILLKAEKVIKSDSRFYELDLTSSLKENFANKTIIEFPILYVVLNAHADMYDIIDIDDEDVKGTLVSSSGEKLGQRRKQRSKQSVTNGQSEPLNFFFNTEFSESDDELNIDHAQKKVKQHMSAFNLMDYNDLVNE